MKPVLFAGPTLYNVSMPSMIEFDMRPPARCGDILQAMKGGADRIGLIDGFFGDCRSVWQKEILFALSQGVCIFGAASMGALRAAECDHYGMIGIGEIYNDYKEGRRTADSDVAMLHGPQELDYIALTLALVDAEATIKCLESSKAITASEAAIMHQTAATLGFRHRTWTAIFANAGFTAEQAAQIKATYHECFVSRKTQDALSLIGFITDFNTAGHCAVQKFMPARTVYLERLLREFAG